jgi:hypothetical protein
MIVRAHRQASDEIFELEAGGDLSRKAAARATPVGAILAAT